MITRGAVDTFGEKLRQERESRGISLDEIAKATKIGTRSLKALEEENFSILPGGIFNKGFVRSYARFLGLDEEKTIAEYQAAAKEEPISVKVIADQNAKARATQYSPRYRDGILGSGLARNVLTLLLGLALVSGVYFTYKRGYLRSMKLPVVHRKAAFEAATPQAQPSAAALVPAATAPPSPATLASSTNPPSPASAMPQGDSVLAAPLPGEFTVSIRTSEESWLSVTSDGKKSLQRLFSANEQQNITARDQVRMVIGNPYGTELSLNGKPLILGGSLDRPRKVVINSSGLAAE